MTYFGVDYLLPFENTQSDSVHWRVFVLDIIYIVATVAFFAFSWGFLNLCDRV